MKVPYRLLLVLVSMTCAPVMAQDQTESEYHPLLSDRFFIGIGLFHPSKDFKLRVDGSAPGSGIDLEQQADASDSETTTSVGLNWRFGEKWSISGQYWTIGSGARWQLDEDFEWADLVFKEGTFAEIGADLEIYRAFFGRRLYTRPGHEFGAGFGVHWLEIEAFIAGQIIIGEEFNTEFRRSSVSAEAPLPNIGAWYNYSWSPKWAITTRFDWLSASVGDYSGSLINAQAGIHYQLFRNAGLGLSWNFFRLDVDVEESDWRGNVESRQSGPYLALDLNW